MSFSRLTWAMGFLAIGTLLLVSCEPPVDSGEYEEKLVVFGNLNAYTPVIDTFFVSLTSPIEKSHETEIPWISNAQLFIYQDEGDTLILLPVADRPGRYLPSDLTYIIRPGREYHLDVTWENFRVTASTTVPDMLSIRSLLDTSKCGEQEVTVDPINLYLEENEPEIAKALLRGNLKTVIDLPMDTIIYREENCYTSSFASPPYFVLFWESSRGSEMVRVISVALKDTVSNAIVDTSFSAIAFKGPMYVDKDGNRYRSNPAISPLFSQPELIIGWLFFNYYGPHLMIVQAVDSAYSNYYEGDPLRINPYVLPNSNIQNGYGLFSSTYSRFFLVYVSPEDQNPVD